jgi:antitoxin component YwqK of YwqJK toxin-antitoxin module
MIKKIDIKNLDFKQDGVGAWYYTLEEVPYTGCAYQMFPNNILASEGNFMNGYQEGIQKKWYQSVVIAIVSRSSHNVCSATVSVLLRP